MPSRYMNTSIESKNSILISILSEVFGDKMNLARIKFFGLFIMALCKVQTVCFEKLATTFENEVKVDSSLRRIQRFMSDYLLDTNLIARLVFALLPHKPPYRLAMDRTNWFLTLSGRLSKHQCFGHCHCLSRCRIPDLVYYDAKIWQFICKRTY